MLNEFTTWAELLTAVAYALTGKGTDATSPWKCIEPATADGGYQLCADSGKNLAEADPESEGNETLQELAGVLFPIVLEEFGGQRSGGEGWPEWFAEAMQGVDKGTVTPLQFLFALSILAERNCSEVRVLPTRDAYEYETPAVRSITLTIHGARYCKPVFPLMGESEAMDFVEEEDNTLYRFENVLESFTL